MPSSNIAIISIGSNIKPQKYIQKALDIIRNSHQFLAESQFVKTKPIGFHNQDDFINGAIKIDTDMSFKELTLWLKNVEKKLNRIRTQNKNGPRTIDLDIVVWNGTVIDKDVFERDFLKNAVFELEPTLF
ncbi:2-amino-4-hydroxy-6-hydroxymethyldihydropteridine diphosphokinase [bacterium]